MLTLASAGRWGASSSSRRHLVGIMLGTALVLVVGTAAAGSARAATYTVTGTQDGLSGDCTVAACSLRDAVVKADSTPEDDTIVLGAATYKLSLAGSNEDSAATGDLDIGNDAQTSGALTLTGAGARTTAIDATDIPGGDRVFDVRPGAALTASHLTITGGKATGGDYGGGGGLLDFGKVALIDVAVRDNMAVPSGFSGGTGGGIARNGAFDPSSDLTLTRVTISGNVAFEGGGLHNYQGNLTATNVTIAGNKVDTGIQSLANGTDAYGGGAEILSTENAQLTNVTVTGNQISDTKDGAPSGAYEGIAYFSSSTATIKTTNVVVAGNSASPSIAGSSECGAPNDASFLDSTTDSAPNLDDDGSCFQGAATLHANPLAGALGDYGGETDTLPLLAGSPAIDAGDTAAAPATDQRGVSRPQGQAADLGAFEYQASSTPPTGPGRVGAGLPTRGGPGALAPFADCPSLTANVIRGTAASNTITGTLRADRIFAGTGNDVVDALAGNDCVDLGAGTDHGQGGLGDDLLLGGLGADTISGSDGNDRLRGDEDDDRLSGNLGADRILGGAGRDRILGGFGDDRLYGQAGADRISGSRGRDRITGGAGDDQISAGSSGDRVAGGQGRDRINGSSGNDSLSGNSSRDRITGGSGKDRISGGSGSDRIRSRDGERDRVSCGSGRDRVVADHNDRVARNCERVARR